MSEGQVWYRSPLYKGRGYSLFLKHTSATIASRIQNSGALASHDELPSMDRSILKLINPAMLEGITVRIRDELRVVWGEEPIPTYQEVAHHHSKALIAAIVGDKEVDNIVYYVRARINIDDGRAFFRLFAEALTCYLLCITPHIRENPTLNEVLHQGRVTGKQVLFPINLYNDIRVKTERGMTVKDLDDMKISEQGTFSVYKTVNSIGTLLNLFSLNQVVPGQKSDYGNDICLGTYLQKGNAVFRDTWNVIVIQLEGLTRLAATYVKTTKLNVPGTPKKRTPSNRPRKIMKEDLTSIQSEIRNIVRDSILSKIKVKIPTPFSLSLSRDCSRLLWYEDEMFYYDRDDGLKLGILYFWNMLKKSQKKKALQKIRNNFQFYHAILTNLVAWEKSEDKHIKKIYTDIVLPASKLKQGRDDVQSTSSSSRNADAKGTESSKGSDNRQAAGVKLRTASGYEGFCSGELPVEEAGGNTNEDNKSSEGCGQPQTEEVAVVLRLGQPAGEN